MRRATLLFALIALAVPAACRVGSGAAVTPTLARTPESPSPAVSISPSSSPGPGGGEGGAPSPDASCQGEGSLRSENGDTKTKLQFVNRTEVTVQTLWLNYEGDRVFYRKVPAGESYVQPTFVTHPWVVADLDGACLVLVVADGDRYQVQVGP